MSASNSPAKFTNYRARSPRRTAIAVAACLAVGALSAVPQARADENDLIVRYDQSQLIRLPRPVSEVIVGNPSIADVTIQGGNLLVVTGKAFGITNIIALDAKRNIIQDQRVIVERDESSTVVLYKGPLRESYSCTPACSPTLTIGDETNYFETLTKHTQSKSSVSMGNAGGGNQTSSQ